MFLADEFFSLSSFSHRSIFSKDEPVWTALSKISKYMEGQPLGQLHGSISKGAFLKNESLISIGKGTVIEPGVFIEGPCIIGENCTIRHGAYLRGNVILGDQCQVGHAAEIKNAIVLNASAITHFVYLGDSIIGNFVNLGAGVKCANLRLDRKEVLVRYRGEKIATGLRKFSAIVGDEVQIGCNCVLNPGTLIGKKSISFPLTNVHGLIEKDSKITPKGVFQNVSKKEKSYANRICQS